MHWEISGVSVDILQKIKKSGVLYNDRKEVEMTPAEIRSSMSFLMNPSSASPMALSSIKSFLVRPKEDMLAREKLQMLQDHYDINDIKSLRHGVLWHFSSEKANIADLIAPILQTNIISNGYAHDCYQYELA